MALTIREIVMVAGAGAGIFSIGTFFGAALALALSRGHVKLLRKPTFGKAFWGKGNKESTS